MTAKIMTRGATLVELDVPDKEGDLVDVVNGFDDVAGYESDANQYFGTTTGRVCNRIGGAAFELNGKTHQLAANDGENHLHGGGARSLDKVVWKAKVLPSKNGQRREVHLHQPGRRRGLPRQSGDFRHLSTLRREPARHSL